jgi:perosamine synthetase
VSPDTLNIDAANVAKRLTQRSKAILAVDYAGHPADLEVLLELARRHELVLIEDACHALGAEYKGKRVGGISDMTVFSFHPAKHITTGEGGMVTTDNAGFAERLRIFRNHGIDRDARRRAVEGQWYYEMIDLGYNYRLTDIGCALGLSQLRRIGPNLSRRRKIAADYAAAFRHQRGIVLPSVRRSARPSWHLYPIRLDSAELSVRRDEVFRALRAEGIGVNVHYIPVHLHPYYRERFGYRGGEYPIAEDAYRHLITLPMFHGMTDRDVDDVIRAVIKVVDHYAA